jgi:RNA polymerase sigma-70 factor (ECF subfamily)
MRISKRYCLHDEDAKDTLNLSFVKVIKNLSELKTVEVLFSWVKQITVRTAIDNFRVKKVYNERNKFSIDDELLEYKNVYVIDDFTEEKLATNEIFELINSLPNITKEVLNLVAIDGYSHKEAAAMLDIKEENSRRHLNKARTILQEKISKLTNFNNSVLLNKTI